MSKKKRVSKGIKDSEIVRAKYAQTVKSKSQKSKLQQALELSAKLEDPIEVPKTGKFGEWFGLLGGFGYGASCVLMSLARVATYVGLFSGFNSSEIIKITIAMSPIFFCSAALWLAIAEIWLIVERNPIRQRRVNILALCASVGICSIVLVPFRIGAPIYLFGCPISVVAMLILYLRQRHKDNCMIEPLTASTETKIMKCSVYVLILMVIMFVVLLIISYQMTDYIQAILRMIQERATSADAISLLVAGFCA